MAGFIELTVGASCSGKTTYAVQKVNKSGGQIINVNRDDIRFSLFGITDYSKYKFTSEKEDLVTTTQLAMADFALSKGKGVIVSDTNLDPKRWEQWKNLAKKYNVFFGQTYFSCPLKLLLERNLHRGRSTDPKVIKMQVAKFEENFPDKVDYFVPTPYVKPEKGVPCWIVDIDGTLAHMNGKRGAFDWNKVGVDDPDKVIINLVYLLYKAGNRIILMSGRDESCRKETQDWLMKYKVKYDHLYMRPEGDMRKDDIVKDELFETHVAKKYMVEGVLDDRNQVVDMWRKKGLKVLQVAEGDF